MHNKIVSVDTNVAYPVFIHYLGEQEGVGYSSWVEPHGPIPGQVSHQVSNCLLPCREDFQFTIGLPDIPQEIIFSKIHSMLTDCQVVSRKGLFSRLAGSGCGGVFLFLSGLGEQTCMAP